MCLDGFAQDNRFGAAPTALGRSSVIGVPALPGWADVWQAALRAGLFRLLDRSSMESANYILHNPVSHSFGQL
jgi:hypothetical protein